MQTPSINMDQVDAMRIGAEYKIPVNVRGFQMLVRPLSIQETIEVASEVQQHLSGLPISTRNALTEHTLMAQKTLQKASTSGPGKTDFQITEVICQAMTPDEMNHLWKQYVAATDKTNPSLEMLDEEKLNAIVEALKKSPKEELGLALIELSFSDLVSLARYFLTKSD